MQFLFLRACKSEFRNVLLACEVCFNSKVFSTLVVSYFQMRVAHICHEWNLCIGKSALKI